MPPKKLSKKSKDAAIEQRALVTSYCETLRGVATTTAEGRPLKKIEALIKLWNLALRGDHERDELFKLGAIPALQSTLDKGEPDEKCAAMGALIVMTRLDKHILEVLTIKVVLHAGLMLGGDHERSKLQACTMLHIAAGRIETNTKVADQCLPVLVAVLKDLVPGWAQLRRTQYFAAAALKLLIDNAEGDVPEVKMARRMQVIELGAVPALMALVAYSPKMPPPPQVPAPIVAPVKTKGKKGVKIEVYPWGSRDEAATSAAGCLRFLAMCPAFMNGVSASGHLPAFVESLLSAHAEQAAYITGVLWEICADGDVAAVVAGCSAVPTLLHVVSTNIGNIGKGKPKKKKVVEGDKGRPNREKEVFIPPNFPDIAVCNAAGALHHLTFLDACKHQFGQSGGVPILQSCLKVKNPQTYENACGALWNVGLDHRNSAFLLAAGAPAFLAAPVPRRLMNEDSEDSKPSTAAPAADGKVDPLRTFLTQAPLA